MHDAGYETTLKLWADIVGPENVTTEGSELRAAETATFSTGRRIPAIIRPASREQVQECLRVASERRAPVYPISSGKNWGYGSRVPASDGCVLMDLGRMNRIVDFSEDLAYVTVEPGVTQAQLHSFLREQKSKLWMDATGASPECSLIGNAMERGFGHTPYGDHFAHACGLEAVLPNGQIVETGFSRLPGAKAGPLYRWGVGPSVDGLFSQSNFGVVTRMTIWLMPAPEYFQAYYFRCEQTEGLAGIIEAIRPLRLSGVIRSALHIVNDYKVLTALRQYPWDETGGQTPLAGETMTNLCKELKIGAWNASGGLYGSRAHVAESRRLLKRALKGKVSKLQFIDDRLLELAPRFAKPIRLFTGFDLNRLMEVLKPVYGLMKGVPTDHPLSSTYWRKRTPPPAHKDPDREGCGLLWFSPVTPADGGHATELTTLASGIMLEHGFEPGISMTFTSDRSLCCVISIAYDRDVPGEDARAMACHHALVDASANRGYYSYRLGAQSMATMNHACGYGALLDSIKLAVDPQGILAPGRYETSGRTSNGANSIDERTRFANAS